MPSTSEVSTPFKTAILERASRATALRRERIRAAHGLLAAGERSTTLRKVREGESAPAPPGLASGPIPAGTAHDLIEKAAKTLPGHEAIGEHLLHVAQGMLLSAFRKAEGRDPRAEDVGYWEAYAGLIGEVRRMGGLAA